MFYLVLLYLILLYLIKNRYKTKYIHFFALLPLIIVILIRYGYGADYFSYKVIYEFADINNFYNYLGDNTRIDLFYKLMMYPFIKLNVPFHVFFSLVNITILLFFYAWIKDSSEETGLSLIIFYSMFFLVWVLSGVRQGLAMSIALYLLFNKKYNWSIYVKLLIIVLLSFMHKSVLFLIPILLMHKIKFNRKFHIAFLIFSLILTFAPIEPILEFLTINDTFWWVMQLYNQPISILSMAVLMRLSFFVLVFLYYDKLIQNEYHRKITDSFLLGISFYFVFSFSEITASRMTIYTFMLIVLLIPILIKQVEFPVLNIKAQKQLKIFLVMCFSVFFLQKESIALIEQTGVITESNFPPFITIFNGKISMFDTRHTLRLAHKEYWDIKRDEINTFDLRGSETAFDSGLNYTTVIVNEDNRKYYGVVSENGTWLILPSSSYKEVYGDIILTQERKNIFNQFILEDISGEHRSEESMRSIISRIKMREQVPNGSDELIIHSENYSNISEATLSIIFSNPKNVEIQAMSRIRHSNGYYYITKVRYHLTTVYVYFDENYELLFDSFILEPVKFDLNGFATIETYAGEFLVHTSGNIVWYYDESKTD